MRLEIVDPFAIVWVTVPVELGGGGGGGGVGLLMVAVMVLVARRVPASLRARTWKVCWPLLAVMVPSAKVSPKGALISDSTWLPSIEELDRAGVVLDLPSPLAS